MSREYPPYIGKYEKFLKDQVEKAKIEKAKAEIALELATEKLKYAEAQLDNETK